MIIIMKPQAAASSIEAVKEYIEGNGLTAHLSKGEEVTIIGVVGDKSRLSTENLAVYRDVDLQEAVTTAVINKRAGGMGLISGRKAFQRPMKDGIALLHAIQDVYLDDEVTIA